MEEVPSIPSIEFINYIASLSDEPDTQPSTVFYFKTHTIMLIII